MKTLLLILILTACAAEIAWAAVSVRRRGAPRAAADVLLTVCVGAVLFWLTETAVARRVFGPAELFRFVGEEGPLPGKAAVLLACLSLSAGMGLTPPGEKARAALDRAAKRGGVLWLAAAVTAALFFVWGMRITVVSFMTNDDVTLLKTFAQIPDRGIAFASGSFSNVAFCALMSLFYRIDPEGWWYAGYHLAALFCACTVLGRCLQLRLRRRRRSVLAGCALQFLLCAGIFLPATAQLAFTVTPAAVGSAACALVLCRDECSSRAARLGSDAGSVVMMLLCYLQRRATGLCVLCFFALAVVYQIARTLLAREGRPWRRLAGLGAAAALLLCLCGVGRSLDRTEEIAAPDEAYRTAEHYRSVVMDYLAGELTLDQMAEVGIPPELGSLLTKQWFFMDERVNTDTFRQLADLYYHPAADTDGGEASSVTLSSLLASFQDDPETAPSILYLSLAAGVLLLLCAAALIPFGRGYLPEFLCALCAFGGLLLMCLYTMLQGRFLYRVFLAAEIPAAVIMALCAVTVPAAPPRSPLRGRLGAAAGLLLLAALCGLFGAVVYHVPYAAESADRSTVFENQLSVESYARSHSDQFFITNFGSLNLDPFHGGSYPSNMTLWGGTGVTASGDRMYADTFFRDDVRFMCQTPGVVMLLMQYLTLDHGPVAALDEAHVTDNIYVFDMLEIRPEDGGDGWYEWNGRQYYFVDGQALTGSRVIDGTEYTFAAPGAAAPMIQVYDGDLTYFTTTAYSSVITQ